MDAKSVTRQEMISIIQTRLNELDAEMKEKKEKHKKELEEIQSDIDKTRLELSYISNTRVVVFPPLPPKHKRNMGDVTERAKLIIPILGKFTFEKLSDELGVEDSTTDRCAQYVINRLVKSKKHAGFIERVNPKQNPAIYIWKGDNRGKQKST